MDYLAGNVQLVIAIFELIVCKLHILKEPISKDISNEPTP